MENRQSNVLGPDRPEGREPDGPEGDDGTVLGVIEDDRLRATVTTTGAEVVVTLEGHLDETSAPVVDELLDAVGRWPGRVDRGERGIGDRPGAPGDCGPDVDRGATLLLDVRGAELEPASRRMLAGHRDRWRREHGPCESLPPTSAQGSNR